MNKFFNINLNVPDYCGIENNTGISSQPLPTSYSARRFLQPPWTHDQDAFHPAQCEGIKKIASSCATVFNPKVPRVYMLPNYRTNWIFDILIDKVSDINNLLFGYDVWGIAEPLQFYQFSKHTEPWNARTDQFTIGPVRKLTFILQLSDEDSYEGSNIQIIHGNNTIENLPRKKGTLCVFPSHMTYGVDRPANGTHDILIGYFTGKELT